MEVHKTMKKIGILTFHNAINYGALLQAYGLQTKIISLGGKAEIIDYDNGYFKKLYSMSVFSKNTSLIKKIKIIYHYFRNPIITLNNKMKVRKLNGFIHNNLILSEYCEKNTLNHVAKKFDAIIVGSDQVWNMKMSNYDETYFLGNIENENKYSYAASFGKSMLTGFEYEEIKKYLPSFKKILVREKEGQRLLKEYCNIDSTVVLDPTLLLSYEEWLQKTKTIKIKKYVLVYLVQEQENLLYAAEEYAKNNKCKIVSISYIKGKKYIFKNGASVEEFLGLIKNAECIFTTSFHGVVFSINFNKDFYYELSKKVHNNNSRIIDICSSLHLTSREILNQKTSFNSIDYTSINKELTRIKENSISELKGIIQDLG